MLAGDARLDWLKSAVGDVAPMEMDGAAAGVHPMCGVIMVSAGPHRYPVADDTPKEPAAEASPVEPEVKIYLQLLVVGYLIDGKKFAEAAECSTTVVDLVSQNRRRLSNDLAAKAFFFYSWAHELIGASATIRCGAAAISTRTPSNPC